MSNAGDFSILNSRWPPAQEAPETPLSVTVLGGRCTVIRDLLGGRCDVREMTL